MVRSGALHLQSAADYTVLYCWNSHVCSQEVCVAQDSVLVHATAEQLAMIGLDTACNLCGVGYQPLQSFASQ